MYTYLHMYFYMCIYTYIYIYVCVVFGQLIQSILLSMFDVCRVPRCTPPGAAWPQESPATICWLKVKAWMGEKQS